MEKNALKSLAKGEKHKFRAGSASAGSRSKFVQSTLFDPNTSISNEKSSLSV